MKHIEAMYNMDVNELEEVMKQYQLTAQQLRAIEYAMALAEFFAYGETPPTYPDEIEEDKELCRAAVKALKQIRTQEITA